MSPGSAGDTGRASIPARAGRRLRRVVGGRLARLWAGWRRRRARASATRRANFLVAVRAAELGPSTIPTATVEVVRLRGAGPLVDWPGRGDGLPAAQGMSIELLPGASPEAAIAASRADLVLVLAPDAIPIREDWLARLVAALADGGVVAATATLVQGPVPGWLPAPAPVPELAVRGRGTIFERRTGIPLPGPRAAGDDLLAGPVGLADPPVEVAAAELACLLVRGAALRAAFEPGSAPGAWEARTDDLDPHAAADLTLRLRAHGRIIGVPAAPVVVSRVVARDDRPRDPGPPRVVDLTPDRRPREAFVAAWGPRLHREAILDALAATRIWGEPLRIELDDRAGRLPPELAAALTALGWTVATVPAGRIAAVPASRIAAAPGPDVRLVTDPQADLRRLDTSAILAGWFADGPPDPKTLEELDLVLGPPGRSQPGPSQSGGAPAWDPGAADAAARLRDHLRAFVERPRAGIWIETLRWDNAEDWGDYHFGRALQRALARAGLPARVRLRRDWLSDAAARDDAVIHLLGRSAVAGRAGQLRILWQISHPELATPELYAGADLALVASEPFAEAMTARTGRPVEPFLQATDPERFRPAPGGAAATILAVANHRPGRAAILGLAGTGRGLAVWGRGWTGILDPDEVRGERLANEALGRAYAAAEIVVSDTWPAMRDEGFIPNRVFDVLASGGFVVSDAIAGLERVFGDAVPTFRDVDELRATVDRWLADAPGRRSRVERARAIVLAGHTFDHRAAVLVARIADGLAGRPDRIDPPVPTPVASAPVRHGALASPAPIPSASAR